MLMKLTLIIPRNFSWPLNSQSAIHTPENHTELSGRKTESLSAAHPLRHRPKMRAMNHNTPKIDSLDWSADELGDGYKRATLDLGADPEGEGNNVAVLVKAETAETADADKPALLWVHGMSDYFFQTHVAEHFTEQGYPFYAIDLHKCGRAHRKGQRWHHTNDMATYFGELTEATKLIADKHGGVVPLAHSTGGLIVPLWLDHLRRTDRDTHGRVKGMILNSPWVDMQVPGWQLKVLRPVVKLAAKIAPNLKLPISGESTYGESIYKGRHGSWDFDTEKKRLGGHDKYVGWLNAVLEGQSTLHDDATDAAVPTLTLCSTHSYLGKPYSPAADNADTVLDVRQIQHWAPTLTTATQETRPIPGALHDVFLSQPHPRELAFAAADAWLAKLDNQED